MQCFVPHCVHYTEKNTCRYFRFPKNPLLRAKWINAIKRKDRLPSNSSRVCSCHFQDQKKENGPTIFRSNDKNDIPYQSHAKKKRIMVDCKQPSKISTVDLTSSEDIDEETLSTRTMTTIRTEAENVSLISELIKLTAEIAKFDHPTFGFRSIEHDEVTIIYYTGINRKEFKILVEACSKTFFEYFYHSQPAFLSITDQVLITLMKLRLNLGYKNLSIRFACTKHTVENIFLTFIHVIHRVLFVRGLRDHNFQSKNILNNFINYRDCQVVIDFVECLCEKPEELIETRETFSSYQHLKTLKALIGIAPNCDIIFAGELHVGSPTHKYALEHSDIMEIYETEDLIFANEEFLLPDVTLGCVSVNARPFLTSSTAVNHNMARAGVHVKKAVDRLKKFRILRLIPASLYRYTSKIFQVCAALTCNDLLIEEVKGKYNGQSSEAHALGTDVEYELSDSEFDF